MIEINLQQGDFQRILRSTHVDERKQFQQMLEQFAAAARARGFVLNCEQQTQPNGRGPIVDVVLVFRDPGSAATGGDR